nr:hypothetical protein [uncultured Carboxylicivirga sp.]
MYFKDVVQSIKPGVLEWEVRLMSLNHDLLEDRRNSQNRTIKEIVGHMYDSASNNTHRIIHLQYQPSPFQFPCYASNGNNDRWIAIQNYLDEDWSNLVQTWKYGHLHFLHVVAQINVAKLDNQWDSGNGMVSLKEMVEDFPRHFYLHLKEIQELIDQY